MEQKSKRDTLVEKHTAFVGDDTGLIKKVRIIAKRIEETQVIRYDIERPDHRKKVDSEGNPIVLYKRRAAVLGAEDNQTVVKQQTDLTFKLQGKYGEQVEEQGIQHLSFTHTDSQSHISYVRGADNIVQVFDTQAETLLKSRQYLPEEQEGNEGFDGFEKPIKGMHSLANNQYQALPHVMVTQDAQILVDDLFAKKVTGKVFKAKGEHVHKTMMQPGSSELAILSKNQTMQLWDVNSEKMTFLAKNVPNDHLDLETPIFDTGLAYLDQSGQTMAVCTGYGFVRTYDTRAGKKCRSSDQIFKESEAMLTHIVKSLASEHHLYVLTQVGHPVMLDRRYNNRVVRKMPGARGTARDCTIFGNKSGQEFVMTVGCDRYLRVFDASKYDQRDTCCGSAYLKQKLSCVLLSQQDE